MNSQPLNCKILRYTKDSVVRQGITKSWLWEGLQITAQTTYINPRHCRATGLQDEEFPKMANQILRGPGLQRSLSNRHVLQTPRLSPREVKCSNIIVMYE